MKETLTLLFLYGNAGFDVRKREISLLSVAAISLYGIILWLKGGTVMTEHLLPLGTGFLFLGCSVFSAGEFGFGDGLVLLALGTVLETAEYLVSVMLGFLLSGIWAFYLLIFQKKSRKTEIPLVPFLLVGYVGGLILCG
ncbi:MAG: prepilin peptidase [Clostridiales bacterium]|nr:prepilin peptidase [Candidatus Blautia equi]